MIQGADDDLLQIEKKAAQSPRTGRNAEHGIHHQLSWKMAGDVSPATGLDQFHALPGENLAADQQVFAPAISTQGDGWRVLQYKERILGPFRHQGQPFQLNGFGLGMTDEPQIDNLHRFSRA